MSAQLGDLNKNFVTFKTIDELSNCEFGGAYRLINAKASFLSFPWRDTDYSRTSEKLARTNHSDDQLFLISEKACGRQATGYQSPDKFHDLLYRETGRVNLAEATTLSGAALSPGRHEQFLVALLAYMLNLWLGQWLPTLSSKKPPTHHCCWTYQDSQPVKKRLQVR